MFCKNCGRELVEGTAYCPQCGYKVEGCPIEQIQTETISTGKMNPIEDYENVRNTEKKHKKGWLKTLIIVMAVLILFTVGIVVGLGKVNGPEETVNRMFTALNANDIDGVMDCYSPDISLGYEGIEGVANLLLGAFGVRGDMDDILSLIPMLAEEPGLDYEIISVEYAGGNYLNKFFPCDFVGKLYAEEARVTVDMYRDGMWYDTRTFELKNYDKDGWLLEEDFGF